MTKIRALLDSLATSKWFAAGSILLLQLKLIWGMWDRKDLTIGDTAHYYHMARAWHLGGVDDFAWSPLYTAFYGAFMNFSKDAYVVTIAHRVVIVLLTALLLTLVLWKLLPPVAAWVASAWWVVLPIHFDSLYEVHLFYFLFILALVLTVLYLPPLFARGVGVALLLLFGVLMRNELFIPLILFGSIALARDIRSRVPKSRLMLAYAAPMLIALLMCTFFYAHASNKWPALKASLSDKHTLNVCQIYAFGYQQRHPEWNHSPWSECQALILSTFGKPEVSMLEATRLNPRAMLDHLLWNIRLIPNGLQGLLFNVISSGDNPDYVEIPIWPRLALTATAILIGILIWGALVFRRNPSRWYRQYLEPNAWGWILILCVAAVVPIIMVTERPRPSYMFTLGLLIAAATSFCGVMITEHWTWTAKLKPLFPIAVAVLILAAPSYYYFRRDFATRPILSVYRQLLPFVDRLRAGAVLIAPGIAPDVCLYLSSDGCKSAGNPTFMVVTSPPPGDWIKIDIESPPGQRWLLLRKR